MTPGSFAGAGEAVRGGAGTPPRWALEPKGLVTAVAARDDGPAVPELEGGSTAAPVVVGTVPTPPAPLKEFFVGVNGR